MNRDNLLATPSGVAIETLLPSGAEGDCELLPLLPCLGLQQQFITEQHLHVCGAAHTEPGRLLPLHRITGLNHRITRFYETI